MSELILASILSADLTRLHDEVSAVIAAGADMIHFDVMDNHYVPNLTFGPILCRALKASFPHLDIDVHLMANPVDSLILECAKAGAKRISIHPDGCIHLDRSLALIREQGCEAGLVLNPATSPECLTWCLERLDFVLIMTVNPGFAGQSLIPAVIDKIAFVHGTYPNLPICVDGGVNLDTIAALKKAGASEFVSGSALFSSPSYQDSIQAMRKKLASCSLS